MKIIRNNDRRLNLSRYVLLMSLSALSANTFAQTAAPPVTIVNDGAHVAWIETAQTSIDNTTLIIHGRIQRSMKQRTMTQHQLVLSLFDHTQQLRETQTMEVNPSRLPFRNRTGMPFTIKLATPYQQGDVVRLVLQRG